MVLNKNKFKYSCCGVIDVYFTLNDHSSNYNLSTRCEIKNHKPLINC